METANLTVEPITYSNAYELVNAFHYLGSKRFMGQYVFGLIQDLTVIGAVVYSPLSVPNSATSAFGLPRGNYPDLLEMSRLVLEPELNGKNYGSMLVGRSLRLLKQQGIRAVISYADSSRHNGAIYQACNFGYYGLTALKSDFFLADGTQISRGKVKGLDGQWRPRTRKHRYLYLLDKRLQPIWKQEPYPKLNEDQ
jgi:GNAT superfamily N-acetyltransferase